MKAISSKFNPIASLIVVMLAGCATLAASAPVNLTFKELKLGADKFSKREVVLSGYLKSDALGNLTLYRSGEDSAQSDYQYSVDVVAAKAVTVPGLHSSGNNGCASVEGIFTAFNKDTVGLGYFRSPYGFIQAKHLMWHGCSKTTKE